jgi:hypothetical protein
MADGKDYDLLPTSRALRFARAFGRVVASCGRGFYGTRERVPFRCVPSRGSGIEIRPWERGRVRGG